MFGSIQDLCLGLSICVTLKSNDDVRETNSFQNTNMTSRNDMIFDLNTLSYLKLSCSVLCSHMSQIYQFTEPSQTAHTHIQMLYLFQRL